MAPRNPGIEYISLARLSARKQQGYDQNTEESYSSLRKLAEVSLSSGPFSIVTHKTPPHIAPSNDPRDFLSYAPYWWPEHPGDSNTKYIRKDGKRNPDIRVVKDQSQLESLAENITYLCLAYYLFEDEKYASHAVGLLDAFFLNETSRMNPNLNYVQIVRGSQSTSKMGRGEGVVSTRTLVKIVNVLPLLNSFRSYQLIRGGIISWFHQYLGWLLHSPIAQKAAKAKNNIHTWYVVQVASMQAFVYPHSDEHYTADTIQHFFQKSLREQIDPKTGDQPLESKRAKPFDYLVFNMQAILFLAELGQSVGLNPYSPNGPIHLAIHYLTTFASKPDVDISAAARCVEIVGKSMNDPDNCCCSFLECLQHSKYANKLGGPKNSLCRLWC